MKKWIPGCVRSRAPEVYTFRYHAPGRSVPRDAEAALSPVLGRSRSVSSWELTATGACLELDGTTWVYGLVRREISEVVELDMTQGPRGAVLAVRSRPQRHHEAHAAGCAGVLALAAVALLAGPAPAGTTLLAGCLWTLYVREMALQRFAVRLKGLVESIGDDLWPGASSEIL